MYPHIMGMSLIPAAPMLGIIVNLYTFFLISFLVLIIHIHVCSKLRSLGQNPFSSFLFKYQYLNPAKLSLISLADTIEYVYLIIDNP